MISLQKTLADLVQFRSVTPEDAGCQEYMIRHLEALGFTCQKFDNAPVANFFASYGQDGRMLLFAGHTDVVPAGDPDKWLSDSPFALYEQNGMIYGRGTADMKGSLACMLTAVSGFIKKNPGFDGRIAFLITSGEEGDWFHLGTPFVMAQLKKQGIMPDYCLIGEPSSSKRVGDVIKIGRRGSLTGKVRLHGVQGHVAYPHLADNPIHKIAPVLSELTLKKWDEGNQFFPPTTFQVTHIQSGGEANNIIPGELILQFNFRYSTEQTAAKLKEAVTACFARHGLALAFDIEWQLNGEPFLTAQGQLLQSCIHSIEKVTGFSPELSTSGGTSDGRFIAPYGAEVIELGLVNATIHQVNECVSYQDLKTLSQIYLTLCETLFLG